MMKTAPGFGQAQVALPITAESQPDLWMLVQDTAARLGVPAPRRIEIYPVPEVAAAPGRLLLGLPYVLDLPADELAAVIAHELVHLHANVPAADALVAQVVSPESVAAALVHGSYLSLTFERFVLQYVSPLAAEGWYPVDLWDAWRWTLRQDRDRFPLPELAGRVTALLGSPALPPPAPGVRPVPLRPLGVEVEAAFAKLLAERLTAARTASPAPSGHLIPFGSVPVAGAGLRAVTFDTADQGVWDTAIAACAQRIRETVAGMGGGHVLDLVRRGRATELLRRCGAESPDLFPVVRSLGPLLADALHRRGYRPEILLQQHLLTGPAFDKIDVHSLISPFEQGAAPSPLLLDLLA
ncbi:M48 family metallopeptidase [Actinocorallia longicatena]|uniref:Peptidase M48 domain-containing protein n=1 Tax=Actinocorallia longicatena TaxID=111803 RepID=A0ABP6Q477_9ACTN